ASAIVALCAFLSPAAALAQTSDVDNLEEDARLRFELGVRSYNRGQFAEAAEEFEAAYRLSERAPLLYNAYLAYRDGRDDAHAIDALRRYLATGGDIPNRARLEETLRGLEADVATPSAPNDEASRHISIPVGPIV